MSRPMTPGSICLSKQKVLINRIEISQTKTKVIRRRRQKKLSPIRTPPELPLSLPESSPQAEDLPSETSTPRAKVEKNEIQSLTSEHINKVPPHILTSPSSFQGFNFLHFELGSSCSASIVVL
ncbi:unnamed protein product [Arabidopsis lyrata]|nr:unnamed protein product [Arabidopsis lyrata]